MKYLIVIFAAILIMSCNQTGNQNNVQTQSETPKRKIDSILNDIFLVKYPNYEENEMVREKATVALKNAIDSLYDKKYLEGIPLKVFRVRKNPHGPGAIVQFYSDNDNIGDKLLSNQLGFDIIGLMSEELASTLSEKSENKYIVFGHKYKRVDAAMASVLVDMTYYSTKTEISTESYSSNKFKIGNFICEVDSIK